MVLINSQWMIGLKKKILLESETWFLINQMFGLQFNFFFASLIAVFRCNVPLKATLLAIAN